MLKGVRVFIATSGLAVMVWFVNIIFLDGFLATLNANCGLSPSSEFYSNGLLSNFAMLESWMPIIIFVLGACYFLFSRVFLVESEDWQY